MDGISSFSHNTYKIYGWTVQEARVSARIMLI